MSLQNKIKNISKIEILLREIKNLPRYDSEYDDIGEMRWGDYLNREQVINLIKEFIGDDNDI